MPESSDYKSSDKATREFEHALRDQLRGREDEPDTRSGARLAATRREALAQSAHEGDARGWSLGIGRPAWGTLAVVALVAMLVYMPRDMDSDREGTVQRVAENAAEPATATEDDEQLELYENLELLEFYEDLEFYEWLADADLEEMPS